MTDGKRHPDKAASLRRRAEKTARARAAEIDKTLSPEAAREALHELRVHQIELEMENEDLRRAQAELEAAQARYLELYDLAPVGYCTLSEEGVILEANLTMATLLDVARGDLVAQPLSRFVLPEDQDVWHLRRKALFVTGPGPAFPVRMVRAKRGQFWARIEATVSRGADGARTCLVSLSDVTERKRTEEALRESEERLGLALESTGLGIWDRRFDTGELRFDERWAAMLGHSVEELQGEEEPWRTRVHPDDRAATMEMLERHLEGDTAVYESEHRLRTKSGGWIWVSDRGRVVERAADGKPIRFIGTHLDITERKRAEAVKAAIYEISEPAQRTTGLDEFLEAVHAAVGRLMEAKNFYVTLHDPAADLLRFPYQVDEEAPPWAPFPPGNGLVNRVLRSGKALLATPEILNDFLQRGEVTQSGSASHYWLGVPLKVGDRTIGVLVVQTHTEGVRYGEWEKDVLTLVSRNVALAIERKRSAEALRDSEAKYRRLHESLVDGYVMVDLDGCLLEFNESYRAMLGYEAAELKALTYQDLTPANWREFEQRIVTEQILTRGFSDVYEKEYRRKDGTVFPVELHTTLLRNPDGEPVAMWGTVRDITERKRAEEALREKERLLSETQRTAHFGGWSLEPGSPIKWTDETYRIYGVAPETFTPTAESFISLLHPEDRPAMLCWIEACAAGRSPGDLEFRAIRPDGSVHTLLGRGGPTHGADGGPGSITGTVQDITKRKRAEEALRESEERYRGLFEHSPFGIYRTTREGRILIANRALIEMLGYATLDELLARNLKEGGFEPDYPRRRFKEAIERDGEIRGFEAVWLTKDGRRLFVRENAQAFRDADGNVLYYEGAVEDVTAEREALEELERSRAQLLQAQKMEAIGRLAGGVAHDFNNILQALLSLATVLRLRAGSPEVTRTVAEIDSLVQRGGALTQELLLFSRREITKKERLDLGEAAREAGALLRRLIPADIRLAIEAEAEPLWVEADRGQIQQVITNLAVNARDAMSDGGVLTIRVGHADGEATLEVADTGHGMDEAVRAHLFEPFFTTKEKHKGSGLGLSVVHGIVEQHGGRIEVDSAPGRGSRFRMIFPMAAPPEETATEQPGAEDDLPQGGGQWIVLVEDEDDARRGLQAMLEMLGYRVTALASGEEAGLLPADPAPDLLLTDLMLPGISGSGLAVGLRDRWPGLPVILMSGYSEDEVARRGIEAGAMRFLQKPFDMAALARELRSEFEKTRPA